jgi:hypothetical protein
LAQSGFLEKSIIRSRIPALNFAVVFLFFTIIAETPWTRYQVPFMRLPVDFPRSSVFYGFL